MDLQLVRQRVGAATPQTLSEPTFAYAAVAVVLRESDDGAEFIVIHRAHRKDDPWSGHMALPGGRQQPADDSLYATAARETFEEVGVDLQRDGELIGQLDDIRAVGRGKTLNLVIRPYVCALTRPVVLALDRSEVQSAFWISLASLRRTDVRGIYTHQLFGQDFEHPAFVYGEYTIWGLTHRILSGLLQLLE